MLTTAGLVPKEMMRLTIVAVCAWPLVAAAQTGSELAPREVDAAPEARLPFGERPESAAPAADDSAVLLPSLRWLYLRADRSSTDFASEGFQAELARRAQAAPERAWGIEYLDLTIETSGLADALSPFLGAPLTENGLDRLIDAVLRYYEAHDRPVTDVHAPAQDLSGGVLLLEVIEGRVGAVGIESGEIFNDELLGSAVRLRGGDLLSSGDLQQHLDWFNRNPFRPASLYAAPGTGAGEADLVFSFSERRPWRVYAGYENSGAEAAGENRYFAGFNWGNAFGLDQLVSYQFTMGDSFEELHAHAASWEIPIHPWHHFVRINGAWADLRTETLSAGTRVVSSGTSWQLGGSYGFQMRRWLDFEQELSFGAEYKSSDNFLVFGGSDAHPGSVVEVVQVRADYRASRQSGRDALEVQASLVASPGGLSGRNTDDDFALFRAGADAAYLYARAGATWVRRLPAGWSLRAAAQAQLASGALLPTEQFALGGHDTVRGYEERDYLADHGLALSAELRATAIEIPAGKLPDTQIQFLGFLDHGVGWRDETATGEDAADRFLGAGAGVRLHAGSFFNLRADLAAPLNDGGGARGHVGVTVAF